MFTPTTTLATGVLCVLIGMVLVITPQAALAQSDLPWLASSSNKQAGAKPPDIDPIEVFFGPDARIRASREAPLTSLGPAASCDLLYNRVTLLLKRSQIERKGFYEDPATASIIALGSIATPAYYLLGVTAFVRAAEGHYVSDVKRDIEALRQRLGDKRCFSD